MKEREREKREDCTANGDVLFSQILFEILGCKNSLDSLLSPAGNRDGKKMTSS